MDFHGGMYKVTMDVTKAIEPRSDQKNYDDFLTGPMTVKIDYVEVKSASEQPVSVHLVGHEGKPWRPSKTSLRCLAAIWGADASKWSGLSLTLYGDPEVTWGGMKVGGIRVSHMEGLTAPRTLMLTKTRGKKGATVIKPLVLGKGKPAAETPTPEQEPEAPPQPLDTETLYQDARDNAQLGRKGFAKWYGSKTKFEQDALKPIGDELGQLMAQADAGN